jgi:hypothetical protein
VHNNTLQVLNTVTVDGYSEIFSSINGSNIKTQNLLEQGSCGNYCHPGGGACFCKLMATSTSRAVLYIFVFVASSLLLTWRLLGENDMSFQQVAEQSHILQLKEKFISNVQNNSLWQSFDPSGTIFDSQV